MKLYKDTMTLYAITDRRWTQTQTLFEQVDLALKGGVTCIQLREKNLDEKTFLEEAKEIKKLCRKYNVPFIINDNVKIAIQCRADGIHLGQDDMNIKDVKKLVGNDTIIGISAHTLEQAIKAEREGADYLGVGAVFSTSTKNNTHKVSYNTLKEICNSVNIPVVAIGGINKKNIKQLAGTNIAGVAVISAIFATTDIEKECKDIKRIIIENKII